MSEVTKNNEVKIKLVGDQSSGEVKIQLSDGKYSFFPKIVTPVATILMALFAFFSILMNQRENSKKEIFGKKSQAYELLAKQDATDTARAAAIYTLCTMYEEYGDTQIKSDELMGMLSVFIKDELSDPVKQVFKDTGTRTLRGDVEIALRKLIEISERKAKRRYDDTPLESTLVNLEGVDLSYLDLHKYATPDRCFRRKEGKVREGKDFATIAGWNLNRAKLRGCKLPNMWDCQLADTDLSGAVFGDAEFVCISLRGAVLTNAQFSGCTFFDSNFDGARFSEPGGGAINTIRMDNLSFSRRMKAEVPGLLRSAMNLRGDPNANQQPVNIFSHQLPQRK